MTQLFPLGRQAANAEVLALQVEGHEKRTFPMEAA